MQFPRLAQLGWNDELAAEFDTHDGLEPGRVTVQHRGAWEVATETDDSLVEITGRLRHAAEPGELPVVGDWVGLRGDQIDVVLPRRSKFSRKTPFTEISEQVLVANVDVAFLVMGLDERDFPDQETLSNVHIFDSEALQHQDYQEKWQALIGT